MLPVESDAGELLVLVGGAVTPLTTMVGAGVAGAGVTGAGVAAGATTWTMAVPSPHSGSGTLA